MTVHEMQTGVYMGTGTRMNNMKPDFNELMMRKEELHKDLQPYVSADEHFVSLKHPLVFDIMYSPEKNAINNYTYKQKREYIKECIKNREISEIIWMYERPHRIEAFKKYAISLLETDPKEYWNILRAVAMDSENIWQWRDDYKKLIIEHDSISTRTMMSDDELKAFKELPDKLTVYRGITEIKKNDCERRNGYSWTLSKETAEFFSTRLKREYEDSVILVGEVDKSCVKAYFQGRNEEEIIVDYSDVVLE